MSMDLDLPVDERLSRFYKSEAVKTLHQLKFGHSVTFNPTASVNIVDDDESISCLASTSQAAVRSRMLQRIPTTPLLIPDLDVNMVIENRQRRYQLHTATISKDPTIFRRLVFIIIFLFTF